MVTTVSQIETLKRDASSLTLAIAGLTSSSGRSIRSHVDDILKDGNQQFEQKMQFFLQCLFAGFYIISEDIPSILKSILYEDDPKLTDMEYDASNLSYFSKMPDLCTITKRQGQIDRQGAGAIVSQCIFTIHHVMLTSIIIIVCILQRSFSLSKIASARWKMSIFCF